MSAGQAHESECTIDDLLVSLYPRNFDRKPTAWEPFFRFINDVQTLSKLPDTVDTIFWVMCYCVLYGIICLGSVNLDLFENVAFAGDFGRFFRARLTVNQAALTILAVSLLIVGYQCGLFIISVKRQNRLDGFNATLLCICLHHLNMILSVTLGVVFGALIVSNVDEYVSQFSAMMLAIAIACMLIPLMVLATIYGCIARFSLATGRGQFEHWELPFGISDLFFAFYMSMNLSIYDTQTKVYKTICSVASILFGLAKLGYERSPTFVSMLAEVLNHVYCVSLIMFPVLGLITAWSDIKLKISLVVLTILVLVSLAAALLVVRLKFHGEKYGLKHMKAGSLDVLSIPSPSAALTAVRLCMTFGIPFVADEEFVKWICLWRFSKRLVPDLVRLCMECKIPLKSLVMPHVTLDQYSVIGMTYLAYQVKTELDRYSHDEDQNVKLVTEELTTEVSRAKRLLQEFWTNKDMQHLTVMNLANQLNQIISKFKMAVLLFPYSERIKKLRNDFAESVVFSVNELKTSGNPNEGSVLRDRDSLYSFLKPNNSPSQKNPIPDLEKETAVEWYLRNRARKNTYPLIIFVYVVLAMTIIVHVIYGELTINRSERDWDVFTNVTSLLAMMFEVSNEPLAIADNSATFPSIDVVMSVLGITQDEGAEFLANRIERNPYLANFTSSFIYLNDSAASITGGDCPNVSMALVLKYLIPFEEMTRPIRRCRILNFHRFHTRIAESISATFDRITPLPQFMRGQYGIFTITIVVSSLILFVVFAILDIIGHKKMLRAVRHITANKPERKEYSRMDYSFSFVVNFFLWIVVTVLLISLYVAYYYPLRDAERGLNEVLEQVREITYISSSAMQALADLEFNMTGSVDLTAQIQSECDAVIEGTKRVTSSGILDIFQNVYPLSRWNCDGRSLSVDLMDFGVMLRSKENIEVDSFEFLYARFLYMKSISDLYVYAKTGMIDAGQKSMQMITTTYLLSSLGILIGMVICVIIFHYLHNRKQIWYFGCSVLLKQAVFEDPSKFNMLLEILEKPSLNFLEKLPFPVVLREQTGRIIYANQQTRPFTGYNPHQLVGQPLEQMFNMENGLVRTQDASLMMTFHDMEPDHELILMHDITKLIDKKVMYSMFTSRMKPRIPLPVRADMYYIEVRVSSSQDPTLIFDAYDAAEDGFDTIQRISCGLTFYTAISPRAAPPETILDFATRLVHDKEHSITAIVCGTISCFSVEPDSTLPIVAGIPVERGHDLIVHGNFGCTYIDDVLLADISTTAEHIIPVSPPSRHLCT